jgi:hypothetical protein
MNNMPAEWQRFAPHIGKIPGQLGWVAYGLCFNALSPDGIDYLGGVEVSSSSSLHGEFSVATIPAQKFAVFQHVSRLRETLDAIDKRLPKSRLEVTCGTARRRTFSSAVPKNSIHGPEWVVWRFGYQSNRDASEKTFCGSEIKGTLLQRPYY